ncbi:hypothetical protein [Streptomyces poriferorum]|uniref:Uncharacterized protein n=1 Tax=Streptomyces poriferorum TaxID=2798799 RepID=A0ABY9IY99_9ACTN|nr:MULTISPECIES: hypothetical protein [unclassified Streptomyces]MDP5310360.1 hypothetical protein [Streptomyces sp. Alt4]WLQ60485.1 hypothetical protein P8A19_35910 [Streptomyces sp. Alt2]
MDDPGERLSSIDERRAAEHAGLWKADLGQAPHYTPAFTGGGWTCIACPLDNCDWHHDDPVTQPSAHGIVEAKLQEHLKTHAMVDFLSSLQHARDSSTALRESNNRAWDVVSLHRLRAVHQGEHPSGDPIAQMLSAALVGTAEHEDVRAEVTRLSVDVAGARNIASVPVAERRGA